MKSHTITKKNLLTYIIAWAVLMLAISGIFAISKPSYAYSASSSNIVTISNANFNKDVKSTMPFAPSSFVPSSDIDENANLKTGVVDCSKADYAMYPENPRSNDKYVLMIKSEQQSVNFGYTMEKAITLQANSNYLITADVYTDNDNDIASLYLTEEDADVIASLQGISSEGNWTTYMFLISTNELKSCDVKLGLYLKGAGTVLYDNLCAEKISKSELDSLKVTANATSTYIDKTNCFVASYDLSQTDNVGLVQTANKYNHVVSGAVDNSISYDGTQSKAFKIASNAKDYASFATKDDLLTFSQNSLYKVSVYAKAVKLNGSAYLQLMETDVEEDKANNSKTLTISSSSSSNVMNGYQEYSFYINSYPLKHAKYKLAISLGSESTLASGEVYVSRIVVNKVDYSTYKDISTGSVNDKLDLTKDYEANSDIMLTNGNFNLIKIYDVNDPYPATPSDWDITTGTHQQYYGVVNTLQYGLSAQKFINPVNPNDPEDSANVGNNNVLMMYNSDADTLTYTSATKTLSAKTYHKFSISVNTQRSTLKLALVANVNDQKITLSSKTVKSEGAWNEVDMYIYSGYQELKVSLEITMTTSSYGYAYLDNATFDDTISLKKSVEKAFKDEEIAGPYISKVDLSNLIVADSNYTSKASLFTANNDTASIYTLNVADANNYNKVVSNADYYDEFARLESENKNVIMLRSMNESDITLKSNVGFALKSSSYYSISVSVYTQVRGEGKEGENTVYARIKLTDFADNFSFIRSDNHWTTYTFYISPDDNVTTYLELSLYSKDELYRGDVFFGAIEIDDTLTESDYKAIQTAEKSSQVLVLNHIEDKSEDKSEETNTNTNWWYYVPSLIFALVIVVAIVVVSLRHLNLKKPTKKIKNDYDRRKTVSKQYYARKATMARQNKLMQLNKELNELSMDRSKYEDDYKKDMARLRELKIKRGDVKIINQLQKDLKKNQKISSKIGLSINKLQAEIDYIKTDAYLSSLIRKYSSNPNYDEQASTENLDE